jgi:hypothetical protein
MALPANDTERRRIETLIADARAAAGPIPFAVAWSAGQALTLGQAIEEALA